MKLKSNKGMTLLEVLAALVILAIIAPQFYSMILRTTKVLNEYKKVIDSGGVSMKKCKVNEPCQGEPTFCLYEPSNNKDVQSCADGCNYVNGQWEYDGKACTQGVVF